MTSIESKTAEHGETRKEHNGLVEWRPIPANQAAALLFSAGKRLPRLIASLVLSVVVLDVVAYWVADLTFPQFKNNDGILYIPKQGWLMAVALAGYFVAAALIAVMLFVRAWEAPLDEKEVIPALEAVVVAIAAMTILFLALQYAPEQVAYLPSLTGCGLAQDELQRMELARQLAQGGL